MKMTLNQKFEAAESQYARKIRTFARNARHQLPKMEIEDIEQELRVVLWKTVEKYDPNKGASFNTLVQGNFKNRIISMIRSENTDKRRISASTEAVDEVALTNAVNAAFEGASAEHIALVRLDIREHVAVHGTGYLDRDGRGPKRKVVAA